MSDIVYELEKELSRRRVFTTTLRSIGIVLSCCVITFLGGWNGGSLSSHPKTNGSHIHRPWVVDSTKATSKWDSTGWTGRVVVGEIYTGVNCVLCQPHQSAFDTLIQRYPYTAFIPLEYHGSNNVPIANPNDSIWSRLNYWYGDPFNPGNFRLFPDPNSRNGTECNFDDLIDGVGALCDISPSSIEEIVSGEVKAIDAELQKAPEAVLHVEATPKGGAIVAKVKVQTLTPPHQDVYVRMLIVEDTVNLKITDTTINTEHVKEDRLNHYMVVRAASHYEGDPPKAWSFPAAVTADLQQRVNGRGEKTGWKYSLGTPLHGTGAVTYVFDMAKTQEQRLHYRDLALGKVRPKSHDEQRAVEGFKITGIAAFSDKKNWSMDPKRLHLVAMVEDAHTGEVLQAQMIRVNTGQYGKLLKLP